MRKSRSEATWWTRRQRAKSVEISVIITFQHSAAHAASRANGAVERNVTYASSYSNSTQPWDALSWYENTTAVLSPRTPRDVAYVYDPASRVTRYEAVWLNGVVVSALGIRPRWPGFDSRVAPLFHWVATLGKLFTHITLLPQFLSSKKLEYKREFSAPKWLWWLSALD